MINRLFRDYFELTFWLAALIALGLSNPTQAAHYTLCPLKLMGITWCPGCGMGHSIAFLLHGDILHSWHAHWLGIPALMIIAYRIVDLIKQRITGRTLPICHCEERSNRELCTTDLQSRSV